MEVVVELCTSTQQPGTYLPALESRLCKSSDGQSDWGSQVLGRVSNLDLDLFLYPYPLVNPNNNNSTNTNMGADGGGGEDKDDDEDADEDELLGLDEYESELDAFILSEEEVRVKERVWVEINRDYLEALAGTFERLFFFSFFSYVHVLLLKVS